MRLVRWALRCYPRSWRERYEDELLDIAASAGVSPRLLLDLLVGAFDARLHPDLAPRRRLRGPTVYDERDLLTGRYPQPSRITFVGILSWTGWTALGVQTIGVLYWLLMAAGLIPYNLGDVESVGTWNGLLWVQLFAAPLVGNAVLRRPTRAAWQWIRAAIAR